MRPAKSFLWVLLLPLLFLNTVFAQLSDDDEEDSDVTARVARISFERGDAQIKRRESKDWERAGLNLPLVEGDEITTGADARIEIQFSRDQFLRLAENSYLKITTLREEGIAVSLSEGTMSIRVLKFDKDKEFFEIDAPKSTVAVQKAGMYRVDAGNKDSKELRVTVTGDGQARVYSEDSGFILRNGRSTKIYLDGGNAGENEIADASRYADEWDTWVLERDAITAKNLQQAHYDEYYDRDMYGAEDLDAYGEWINTKKYGYVWRPYKTSVAGYADWSPYRYGQWRWVPPYGWTWVNDEPWGWATYHHGRWVYEDDYWCWTPYPQHRPKRSWWKPALVVVINISNDICWYPLPYDHKYRNYNRHRDSRRDDDRKRDNRNYQGRDGRDRRFDRNIPPTGVVAAPKDRFGNDRRWVHRASTDVANRVLSKEPSEIEPPSLPRAADLADRPGDVFVQNPRYVKTESRVRTGASERRAGVPLDGELRRNRIWGNRPPVERRSDSNNSPKIEGEADGNRERRRTGAFERNERTSRQSENKADNDAGNTQPRVSEPTPPTRPRNDGDEERRRADRNRNRDNDGENRQRRDERRANPEPSQEQRTPPPRNESPREDRRERPQQSEQRREQSRPESPRQREEPKREEPRREEQRREEPKREEPKREEPRREEPAPTKPSDTPKGDDSPRPESEKKPKDG